MMSWEVKTVGKTSILQRQTVQNVTRERLSSCSCRSEVLMNLVSVKGERNREERDEKLIVKNLKAMLQWTSAARLETSWTDRKQRFQLLEKKDGKIWMIKRSESNVRVRIHLANVLEVLARITPNTFDAL